MDVRTEQFYSHENQCTQILNLSSPVVECLSVIASVLLLSKSIFFSSLKSNLIQDLFSQRSVDLPRVKHSAMFVLIATVILCYFKYPCALVDIHFNNANIQVVAFYHLILKEFPHGQETL